MACIAWNGFTGGSWQKAINVRDFITENYTPYEGTEEFLTPPTSKTQQLWLQCQKLLLEEYQNGGILDIDTETPSGILSHTAGYIEPDLEIIKGLQTDKALKRAVVPRTGIRMARQACESYGYTLSPAIEKMYGPFCKTHNDGVFSAYTQEMRKARKTGLITGLPDAYGRGRIIGDYRRVALYGIDRLLQDKEEDLSRLSGIPVTDELIRLREEVHDQITALRELVALGASYGFDLSRPAETAFEAVQWIYLAFLGAIKETNGAANSLGRVSTFIDIYMERDLAKGILTEEQAQELIDQFVIKLRLVRHLRTPEYNELFAGDPVWITEVLGGMNSDGRPQVTKTTYRFLHTLYNLGPAPEPNLTVLWSERLPAAFKSYCARVSMETSSIQYENDDGMRPGFGDDYSISCCVSAMRTGKDMQFFGARCNLPKLLLLALNGGRDEITGEQVGPVSSPIEDTFLDFKKVMKKLNFYRDWLAALYADTMNLIHHMHDKYAYERLMMALHDTDVNRFMAFGIAGLSVAVDSLSAIKHTGVKPLRNERGLITEFELEGDYPKYGNNDDRADTIAISLVKDFYNALAKHSTYRNAAPTLSILTITSNVVYGKKTGATPDGRKKGEPFAPGANPMHGRDTSGTLAVLSSAAKLPYQYCKDGISLTMNFTPRSLGKTSECRTENLVSLLEGYFSLGGHHMNVNVLDKAELKRAMEDPHAYPQLTVRVSGYAVNFNKLTKAQQLEVLSRTFH